MSFDKNYSPKLPEPSKQAASGLYNQTTIQESPLIYQLKQQREYHFRKMMDVQAAIDAVNRTQY